MATRYGYSRALRTLGQTLEKRGIDFFDLRCHFKDFYLQCGDPTPPYLSLIDLHYSLGDLDDLDLNARAQRGSGFKVVNFEGLPEVFRAMGRRLEEKDAQLVRICNADASVADSHIRFEYQTRDGRKHIEKLFVQAVVGDAMRMYKNRLRAPEPRGWK